MNPLLTAAFSTAADLLAGCEDRLNRRTLDGVIGCLDEAERRGADPDTCAAQRWTAHMLGGDFEAAWCENDNLRNRGSADPHRFWMREDIRGRRLILRCLHGFGDAVQMLRYVPRLQELASELIVEVPPRLMELAPCFEGMKEVQTITWGEGAPTELPEWDVQAEIMELPYLFRTVCGELPLATRYLAPDADKIRDVRAVIGSNRRLRVGVVWAAGEWNPERSIPLHSLRPLLRMEGCEFWSLQGGRAAEDWDEFTRALAAGEGGVSMAPAFRDAAECGDGILTLAAVIAQLDLVVTVDTLAAHLAGAIGVPAWVLLQYAADWRWMTGCADSPWYPTLRLIRQSTPGDWNSAVAAVVSGLRGLTRRAPPAGASGTLLP